MPIRMARFEDGQGGPQNTILSGGRSLGDDWRELTPAGRGKTRGKSQQCGCVARAPQPLWPNCIVSCLNKEEDMSLIIESVHAREILDSRGNPTAEVAVELADRPLGRAPFPRAASP